LGSPHADEEPADRVDFGSGRPRTAPGDGMWPASSLDHLLAFGVDTHDSVEAGRHLEPDREHAVGDAGEVVDAAMTHEGFEADDPALVEDREVVEVVRDKTPPEAEIHQGFL